MRVLIVGTGSIGARHMRNLRSLVPNVRIDILRESGRNTETTGLGEVEVVQSINEALQNRPDLIVISNPSSMHLRPLRAAIESGTPFYVEKPIVSTYDDLVELKALVEMKNVAPNIVGCNLRFLPSLVRLKSIIESGRLGNLVRADFEAGQWLPDWRPQQDYRLSYSANRSKGGGVLLDLIHELDSALWLLGELNFVSGYCAQLSNLEIDSEDSACILLAKPRGPIVTVRIDYVSRRPVRRYTIVGDRGTVTWDLREEKMTIEHENGTDEISLPANSFDVSETYIAAMNELLIAIRENRQTTQPLEEGLKALELVLCVKHTNPTEL